MQRYRSGHNGADSKSVCEQSHEGSNPSRCAKSPRTLYRSRRLFYQSHLPHVPPPDLRKQTVFLHDTQDSLGIAVNASLLQLQPHPAVAIRTKAALSLFHDDFCKGRVFLRPVQTMDEIIVSASGYLKKATHNGYRIFISVPVDYGIFCPWPHFLPVERRKSRNSSFSNFSRLFSYLYSASIFAGLRPRAFGRTGSFSPH